MSLGLKSVQGKTDVSASVAEADSMPLIAFRAHAFCQVLLTLQLPEKWWKLSGWNLRRFELLCGDCLSANILSNLNQSNELRMMNGIFSEADVVGGSDVAHLQQKERSITSQV